MPNDFLYGRFLDFTSSPPTSLRHVYCRQLHAKVTVPTTYTYTSPPPTRQMIELSGTLSASVMRRAWAERPFVQPPLSFKFSIYFGDLHLDFSFADKDASVCNDDNDKCGPLVFYFGPGVVTSPIGLPFATTWWVGRHVDAPPRRTVGRCHEPELGQPESG